MNLQRWRRYPVLCRCPILNLLTNRPPTLLHHCAAAANAAGRGFCCGQRGGLLAVLLLAACVGVLLLRSAARAALPVLDGDLHVAGLSAPVLVRRDAHGVPHIEAATQDDLFVAQGYVTAQDRLWQMDAFRRNANGELAEILGPSLVRHDKMQRNLQFRLIGPAHLCQSGSGRPRSPGRLRSRG